MRLFARLGLLMTLFALAGVSGAAACSLAPAPLDRLVQQSTLIVVGTVSASTDDSATVEVEQYLKGGDGEREIGLLNRWIDLGPSCERSLGSGVRFAEGTRLLLFLEPNTFPVDAPWQTNTLTAGEDAAWVIVDDQVNAIDGGRTASVPLLEVTARITTELAADGTSPVPEMPAPPAVNPPADQPLPLRPGQMPFVPTATLPDAESNGLANSPITTIFPWALIAIGVVSGGLALWGWARGRREDV